MKPWKTCERPSLRDIHCSESHAEAATEVSHFTGRTRVAVLAGIAVGRIENLLLSWHFSLCAVLREDKSGFTIHVASMVRFSQSEAFQGLGLGPGFEDSMQEQGGMDSPSSTHLCHDIGDTLAQGHSKDKD